MSLEMHPAPRTNANLLQFVVEARDLGRYTIDVSLPAAHKPGEKFPVIVVTDGNMFFDTVQAYLHGGAGIISYIPPVIIVGVGYPADEGLAGFVSRRNFDFYGDWDMTDAIGKMLRDSLEPVKTAEGKPELEMKAGGAVRFSDFLRRELLPGLSERFPIDVSAKHTLVGCSSGGHYVLRALYDPDSPFSRYICISPAFGAGAGAIEKLEAQYAASHDDLEARLYVCCGQEEVATMGFARIGTGVMWVAEQFASRAWKSAHVEWEILNNENHHSSPTRAIASGLRSVFGIRPGVDKDPGVPVSGDQNSKPDPR